MHDKKTADAVQLAYILGHKHSKRNTFLSVKDVPFAVLKYQSRMEELANRILGKD